MNDEGNPPVHCSLTICGGIKMGISLLESIQRDHMRFDIPAYRIGDTVKVHVKIREGDKERIQVFEGLVIRTHGPRWAPPLQSGRFRTGSAWNVFSQFIPRR